MIINTYIISHEGEKIYLDKAVKIDSKHPLTEVRADTLRRLPGMKDDDLKHERVK